jgi:hypothetical protein
VDNNGASETDLPRSSIEPKISDALLLTVASGASYAFAFTYEAGFASLYHFPLSLISLNLTTGLVAAAAGASALVLSATTLSILAGSLPRSIIPSGEAETRYFAWRLLLTLFLAAYLISWLNLVLVVVSAIVFWALPKGSPASLRQTPNVIGWVFERLNSATLLTLDLLVCLLLGAFILGRYRAISEPQFIFDKDSSHYVVLRIYGDTIVSEPYVEELSNHNNYIVGGGLRFFKVGDKETPELRSRPKDTSLLIPRARLVGVNPWDDWAFPYK